MSSEPVALERHGARLGPEPVALAAVEIGKVETENRDSDLIGRLESPTVGAAMDALWIPLIGWAVGKEGDNVNIEVAAGDTTIRRFERNVSRPDVGRAFPRVADADNSGFSHGLGVARLPREFELVLSGTVGGRSIAFARVSGRRRALHPIEDRSVVPLPVTTLGRTGSTLLTTLLGEHPDIVAFEPHAHDSRPFNYWLEIGVALAEPNSRLGLIDSHSESNDWWLGRGSAPAEPFLALDAPMRAILAGNGVDELLHFVMESAATFAERLAEVSGHPTCRYAAEKCWPNHVPRLMHELCPATHEIFLVRDFRDVVASILAFNAKRGYAAFGREHANSDEEFIDRLAFDVAALARSWTGRRDRSVLIRYEDLVTDPHEVLADLFSRLAIDGSTKQIGRVLERAMSRLEAARATHQTSPAVSESIGRWRRDLPAAVSARCEESFQQALELFGYA
jgi:hypothetical protein